MSKYPYMPDLIEASIQGIPCLVHPTYVLVVPPWKGSAHTCPSDLDYYGYAEVEFDVYDRKGYPAAWLERKMDQDDREKIEDLILNGGD